MAKLCSNILYGTKEFFAPEITTATEKDSTVTVAFSNVKASFVVPDNSFEKCGFTIEDEEGKVPFKPITAKDNTLILELERPLKGAADISFAFEANPTHVPPLDEITFLPPLAFYHYPITKADI